MSTPKNLSQTRMRDWPMFQAPAGKQRTASEMLEVFKPPRISELIMEHIPGSPAEKLSWLRQQYAEGKLGADDPEEIAQAEALLTMLGRFTGSKVDRRKRHLDELLDEGLAATFPASDPVTVGHFTGTEPPSRAVDQAVVNVEAMAKRQARRTQVRSRK